MSDQVVDKVLVETKLEGGSVAPVAATAPAAVLDLNTTQPSDIIAPSLEGGMSRKRRKTRSDKGKKGMRRKYLHPSKKYEENVLSNLEYTPGGMAVYKDEGSKRCRRHHSYSKEFGTCVSRRTGHRLSASRYRKHRAESGPLRSRRRSRSRTRSRSRSRK